MKMFYLRCDVTGTRYLGGKLNEQLFQTEPNTEYVVDSDINILRGTELKLSPGKMPVQITVQPLAQVNRAATCSGSGTTICSNNHATTCSENGTITCSGHGTTTCSGNRSTSCSGKHTPARSGNVQPPAQVVFCNRYKLWSMSVNSGIVVSSPHKPTTSRVLILSPCVLFM